MTKEQLHERAQEIVDGLTQMGCKQVVFIIVADGCVVSAGAEDQTELMERLHECANDWLFTDPLEESTPVPTTEHEPW